MFLDFIADVADNIGSISDSIRMKQYVRMPEPQIRIVWDWEEGKPNLEINDKDPFDPKMY